MLFHGGPDNLQVEHDFKTQAQRWQLHIHQTPLAVIEWDLEGRVRSWNPAAERMFGYLAEEAIGQSIIQLIVPPRTDLLDQVHHIADDLTHKGQRSKAEHENRRKDGSSLLCRWFNTPLTDETGCPLGVASMALDVTEIQRATRALEESELRFRTVADFTHDWEYWNDEDGRLRWMSPSCERVTGYSMEAFEADPDLIARICHPEDRTRFLDHVHAQLGEDVSPLEFRIQHQDGREIWISHVCVPVRGLSGEAAGRRATNQDITGRKKGEDVLREAHRFNEQIIHSLQEGLVVYDRDLRHLVWNPFMESLSGLPAREVLGKPPLELFPFLRETGLMDRLESALAGAAPVEALEMPFLVPGTGRSGWTSNTLSALRDSGGEIVGVIATVSDITARKAAERALRESEQRFRTIFERAIDGIVMFSPDGELLDMNEAFAQMHGYTRDEMRGFTLVDMDTPETAKLAPERMQRMLDGETLTVEIDQRHRDGHTYVAEATASLVYLSGKPVILSFHRDITERKRGEKERLDLQAQLQQAQKMESLGALAGGIAHDMNNVLGAILGLASANIEFQPTGSPAYRTFDTIAKAATRGGEMVKSLLSFARQSRAETCEVDLNALLRDEVRLLERTTLARICLDMELAPDLRPIRGDASALTHAFMNLCINAVDAMAENGTLTLRTRNLGQDWIEVEVEDTGTGMSQDIVDRALEPFFTTKGVGKGTGLGLSMVYSTVKAHQGQMELRSAPGRGTRVVIRFPAHVPKTPSDEPARERRGDPARRALKVLIVDDDELIQGSMEALLAALGHRATLVSSGEEALARLAAGLQPDVVLLDMNMPGLGGSGTLPHLRALHPALPVLLATGRADQAALDLVAADANTTLLSKPFALAELRKHLEQCIPRDQPGPGRLP
jgi:PAS domain S-box-containing protein